MSRVEELLKQRKYYNNKDYTIDFENRTVTLSPELETKMLNNRMWNYTGYKKVGGSSIGSIFDLNPYATRFNESIRIMHLAMPMYDSTYVDAGKAIEPKIISELGMAYGTELQTFDGQKYKFDYFKEQEHVGGLPDAYETDRKIVFEIKTATASKYEQWQKNGVPKYYQLQAALYGYLMGAKKVYIVACFLEREDYANPEAVDITKRKRAVYKVEVDDAKVAKAIELAGVFRQQIKDTATSFPWNPDNANDIKLLSYLMCENQEEYISWLIENNIIER